MRIRLLSTAFIVLYLLTALKCTSSNEVVGGSTDIEVIGQCFSQNGDTANNVIVTLFPDTIKLSPSAEIPLSLIDTTSESGGFKISVPSAGSYTIHILDTVNHESYYKNGIPIDSSTDLGFVYNTQTANLVINIPQGMKEDSGYCLLSGTQKMVAFSPLQNTVLFTDVPSKTDFPITIFSSNNAISSKEFIIESIGAGETDTLFDEVRVLYIIDTTTIKETYAVDLADSIDIDDAISVTVTTVEEFKGADTANTDIVYIASNVDHLINTKWFPLVATSKPVICASSSVYHLINLADNIVSDTGSTAMNATTISASTWNVLFSDLPIASDSSFNLFSSDTTQKFTVEWGVPNINGKIVIQGPKPLFFYYEKGDIMPDENNAANGIRVALYGCNEQQFNSEAIEIIRNTIIKFGK